MSWLDSPEGLAARAEIDRAFDEGSRDLTDLLAALIAEPSVNPPGDCAGVAHVVTGWLGRHGIACETIARRPEKPNLVATAKGSRPGPHLILNGHMDTIPPGDESAWSVPLYRMSRQDDRLTGLGAGNMKGALAALTFAFAWLVRSAPSLAGRLTYTAVCDETVFGPDGAGFLLDTRPDLAGDAVICGEGSGEMTLGIAEKGVLWISLEAACQPGQGMLTTRNSTAVARLAAALTEIDLWNEIQVRPPQKIAAVGAEAGPHRLRLSANVGRITGGHFVSQVAARATAEIDLRIPPGLTLGDVQAKLDELAARHEGLTWRMIKGWEPNWTAESSAIARALATAARAVTGHAPAPVVRLPASDASRWRARGVPSVCYGPQPLLASGTDDYVLERDLIASAKVYALAALAFLNAA